MSDLFDVGDVIHSYSDAQALADGMLVDLPGMGATVTFHGRQVDCVSRALCETFRPFIESADEPASSGEVWPYLSSFVKPFRTNQWWGIQKALRRDLNLSSERATVRPQRTR